MNERRKKNESTNKRLYPSMRWKVRRKKFPSVDNTNNCLCKQFMSNTEKPLYRLRMQPIVFYDGNCQIIYPHNKLMQRPNTRSVYVECGWPFTYFFLLLSKHVGTVCNVFFIDTQHIDVHIYIYIYGGYRFQRRMYGSGFYLKSDCHPT